MFEGRPLSEIGYPDLKAFLEERREEGFRLDYKEQRGSGIVRDACAMANTYGGDILVGVKEVRDQKSKTNRPDPEDVPGIDRSAKDWKASVTGMIRSRTRPPVVPEVAVIDLPDKPDRAVVVIRVEESLDAPHEVHVSSSPETPVRRGDSTESACLDDVERLIYRRDQIRQGT